MTTLGQRLAEQAEWIAARHLPDYPWAGPVAVLLDHVTGLAAAFEGRFERVAVDVPGRPPVRPAPMSRPGPATAPRRSGRPLPADVAQRLRAVAGPGTEVVRVHDDAAADALAAAHRAEAVTVGADVHFRAGRLNPRDPRGFALLVHEATHVLEGLRPGAAWRRSTTAGVRDEERTALATEAAAAPSGRPPAWPRTRNGGTVSSPVPESVVTPDLPAAPHPAGHGSRPAPASRPMAAAEDREPPAAPAAPAPIDLAAIRDSLLHELRRQLRDEFERGG